MLFGHITSSLRAPAELSSLPSSNCSLLVLSFRSAPFRISNLEPLFANTRVGVPPTSAPVVIYRGRRGYERRSCVARIEALWWAIASMEIMGFTPEALGKAEPSMTYRLGTSHVWPSGLVADALGEPPMRALPMMWNEKSASCPASQPAESMACMKLPSEPRRPGS